MQTPIKFFLMLAQKLIFTVLVLVTELFIFHIPLLFLPAHSQNQQVLEIVCFSPLTMAAILSGHRANAFASQDGCRQLSWLRK